MRAKITRLPLYQIRSCQWTQAIARVSVLQEFQPNQRVQQATQTLLITAEQSGQKGRCAYSLGKGGENSQFQGCIKHARTSKPKIVLQELRGHRRLQICSKHFLMLHCYFPLDTIATARTQAAPASRIAIGKQATWKPCDFGNRCRLACRSIWTYSLVRPYI